MSRFYYICSSKQFHFPRELSYFTFHLFSGPAAALDLTMVFLPLDMEPMEGRITGWSKIPGEPSGE